MLVYPLVVNARKGSALKYKKSGSPVLCNKRRSLGAGGHDPGSLPLKSTKRSPALSMGISAFSPRALAISIAVRAKFLRLRQFREHPTKSDAGFSDEEIADFPAEIRAEN